MQKIIKITFFSLLIFLFVSCENSSQLSNAKKEFQFNRMIWLPTGKALISWKGNDTSVELYIDNNKVDPIKKEEFCLVFDYPNTVSTIELKGTNNSTVIHDRLTIDNTMTASNLLVKEDTKTKSVEFVYPDKVFNNEKEYYEYEKEKTRYNLNPMPCNMWDISWDVSENVRRQFINIIYNDNYTTTYHRSECNLRDRLFWYLDEEKNKDNIEERKKPVWKLYNDYRDENATQSQIQVLITVFNNDMTKKGQSAISPTISYPVIVK